MELTINSPVKGPVNTWEVVVSYMYGDADGNGAEEYQFKKGDEELLKKFVFLMEKAVNIGGGRDYNCIPGWDDFFGYDNDIDPDYEFLPHYDPQSQDCLASLEYYNVFFYDENGTKTNVSVKLTESEKSIVALMKKITWNKQPTKEEWAQIFRDHKLEGILS